MQVTVNPLEFEEVRLPAGMRVRVTVDAGEDIDVAVMDQANYERFCEADSEEGIDKLQWHEEVDNASFVLDVPDAVFWLILWNAYEDDPVSVEYEITPL